MNYKVEHLIDTTYQVYEYPDDAEQDERTCVFKGNLSDCEAYIRLKEGSYL